jgi:glycosyltransferase involved in cell wall biosynthesis
VRLTALVESPEHVCCRYRLAAYAPFLEKTGYHLSLRTFPPHSWHWFRLARELRSADIVVLQRKLQARWKLILLRRSARVLFYDFDDALFFRDSYAAKGLHSARRERRFAASVRAADVVLAGNSFLRDQAARWIPLSRIQVLPTCVDPRRYRLADHEAGAGNVQLVWIGSSSTLRGLDLARPLLEHVGQHCAGSRLKIVCDGTLSLRHLPVVTCPWSGDGEAESLASADIGISWVPDDPWSRGKCGLKVLQYMAAGLPVVANPAGVQAEIVRHGETGYLAETATEWAEAIGRLASNPALRRQMGRAGRRRVEENYSVEVGAARWTGLLRQLPLRKAA